MRDLERCIAWKAELSWKAMLSVFQAEFVHILFYDDETKKIISRVKAAKMKFFRAIVGVTKLDRVRNEAI